MAGEVEAFLETLEALRKAEAALRREADPATRSVLSARVAEWKTALHKATREVQGAAAREDRAAGAFLDNLRALAARGNDGEG